MRRCHLSVLPADARTGPFALLRLAHGVNVQNEDRETYSSRMREGIGDLPAGGGEQADCAPIYNRGRTMAARLASCTKCLAACTDEY